MTSPARPPAAPVAARWVSIAGHPFVMAAVMVLGTALRSGTAREALSTTLLVALVALLPVAVLMVRQVRAGAWKDVDASERAERPLLFSVGIGALAALVGIVLWIRPGSFLVRGAVAALLMLALAAVATRWIKVSLHMAFGALAATTLLLVGSPAGWALVLALPALAWSRLAMGRHRAVEVVLGAMIGAAFGIGLCTL